MNSEKKAEILAPAGDFESIVSSVRSGADAVYVGLKEFSARASAANLDLSELRRAVSYCHKCGTKIYVAFNIIIKNEELKRAEEYICSFAKLGIDGIIFQDMAVCAMARKICPSLKLTCSTQMTLHNRAGMLFAREIGASRVVLPRELSKKEIEILTKYGNTYQGNKIETEVFNPLQFLSDGLIAREGNKIETEVFVHGAQCMSVSGQCLLSCMIGGRSGNRGRCAGPCRLDYKIENDKMTTASAILSLKDMSIIDKLGELNDMGVSSFKIEGRLKGPEYSAAVSGECRKALDGEEIDIEKLGNVFSRSNIFSDGYYNGKRDTKMFGMRTDEDKTRTKKTLNSIHEQYRRERQSVKIELFCFCRENVPTDLKISKESLDDVNLVVKYPFDNSIAVSVSERAENSLTDTDYAVKCLEKTGGTVYKAVKTIVTEKIPLSPAKIKTIRRLALETLDKKREEIHPLDVFEYKFYSEYEKTQPSSENKIICRFYNFEQIFDQTIMTILPLDETISHISKINKEKIIVELETLYYPDDEEKLLDDLKVLIENGVDKCFVQNLSQVMICKSLGFTVYASFTMNIANKIAFGEYRNLGCDFITESVEVEPFAMQNAIRVVYGKIPVMTFRNCPNRANFGCTNCKGEFKIIDRKNEKYTCICHNKKFVTMHSCISIGERMSDISLVYFTDESREMCREIYEKCKNNEKPTARTIPFKVSGGE